MYDYQRCCPSLQRLSLTLAERSTMLHQVVRPEPLDPIKRPSLILGLGLFLASPPCLAIAVFAVALSALFAA
jgi:hypothetical protein